MISPVLKDFIEHNSELLENDLRAFLGKALAKLRGTVFEKLIQMLEDAQIDFEDYRTQMLINKLGFIFPDVEDYTPLTDVLKDHLLSRGATTFFGLPLHDLVDFVVFYKDKWRDDMHLEEHLGILMVRTNND
jgi:hypothetical protein